MAGNVEPGQGGGVHPGRPVIWPNAQLGKPVSGPGTTQTPGGVRGVPVQTPVTRAPGAVETTPTTPAAPAKPALPIVRPLTLEDIRAHLLSLQIQDTDFNVRLAQLMLKYGVELSRENLTKALQSLEGTSKGMNIQEALLVLLSKGIDSPEAIRILSEYLSQNPKLAEQIRSLQEAIANLQNALGIAKNLNPTLLTQIVALITQFDQSLSTLPETYRFGRNSSVSRKNLVDDLRGLKGLLEGLQNESVNLKSGEREVLSSALMAMIGKLNGALDNLIAQAILSQPGRGNNSSYLYHQVPNSLSNPPQTVEILVKRDGSSSNAIDPANTQIVISLDTPNLGKLAIAMDVKEKNVRVLFNTENEEVRSLIASEGDDLKEKLADKNYQTTGFQVKVNKAMCAIKPYLIPLLGLENLLKIDLTA